MKTHGKIPTGAVKTSFYLYRELEKIHSDFQKMILQNGHSNVLLIMNTPGSLEKFMVHTEPVSFRKIFTSLLTRALEHTAKGCIEFGYVLDREDHFQFFVRDSAGTQSGEVYRIPDRYESGLHLEGLSETREIVELLGGMCWVEIIPGRSSSWWFTIDVEPVHSSKTPYLGSHDRGPVPDWSGKAVLVVEDVYHNYLLLETALARTNLKFINVENGMKAVHTVRKRNDIDLVLMDLRLPVLDGYEASRRIKSIKPWLPIVALSAYAFGDEIERCLKAGCDSFLPKPFNTSELIMTMSDLFEKPVVEK